MSVTKARSMLAFRTPGVNDEIWFSNPGLDEEDPEDKKTPSRLRFEFKDHLILVEQVDYIIPPPPEVRAAAKARGEVARPFRQQQYYIHFLSLKWKEPEAYTFKVYKHQGKVLYADSTECVLTDGQKSGPDKSRATRGRMIAHLARVMGCDVNEATAQFRVWVNWIDEPRPEGESVGKRKKKELTEEDIDKLIVELKRKLEKRRK